MHHPTLHNIKLCSPCQWKVDKLAQNTPYHKMVHILSSVYNIYMLQVVKFCLLNCSLMVKISIQWLPGCFFSSDFSPRPLNETGHQTRLVFISWNSESKFFGQSILMTAGDTCAADSVDTVHHEMSSMVCNHRVYKSVYRIYPYRSLGIYFLQMIFDPVFKWVQHLFEPRCN